MLVLDDIPHLITDDFGFANSCIYIGVGMTIYPHIDTTVDNEVAQFRSEGTVDERIQMLRCHHLSSRQVMGNHNNLLCRTLCNALPDKVQAELMQLVIFIHLDELSVVFGLMEIIQSFPHEILILCRNV